MQNASHDGPLRALFRAFDAHVQRVCTTGGSGPLFDQTLLNLLMHQMLVQQHTLRAWLMRTWPW